ncbi:MAG: hypothetical protein JWM55_1804 [Acidimicrobiaceae bacterium]|nr:hypothetical protein [Acidimicrobiaceae bacterium]
MALHEWLGRRLDISVIIDPIPAATEYIDAGGLKFGVEYRELNAAIIDENFGDDPAKSAAVEVGKSAVNEVGRQSEVEGVAIHVFDSETNTEYLRLDAFPGIPHYHYIFPGSHHTIIHWDEIAQGSMIDQLPTFLEDHLEDMLLEVVPRERVSNYRMDEVRAALPQIYAAIDKAGLASQRNKVGELL